MYVSLADRSTRQLLKRLARLDVLLVDELGYFPAQNSIFGKSTAPGERPPGVEVVGY
jgi:hypothetical protein